MTTKWSSYRGVPRAPSCSWPTKKKNLFKVFFQRFIFFTSICFVGWLLSIYLFFLCVCFVWCILETPRDKRSICSGSRAFHCFSQIFSFFSFSFCQYLLLEVSTLINLSPLKSGLKRAERLKLHFLCFLLSFRVNLRRLCWKNEFIHKYGLNNFTGVKSPIIVLWVG